MSRIPKQTLWKILSGPQPYRILIPRIQRDYAHGRKDKAAKEVRTTLVEQLIGSLEVGAPPVDLGLIFGAADDGVMTLYDGQQRFTTLFLLHWSLAWLAGDKTAGENLKNFSYNSRLHSRDFCRALITKGLTLDSNATKPSTRFLDEKWFCPAWLTDPTVAGMLVVLDLMHESLPKEPQEAAKRWECMKADQAPNFSWLVLGKQDRNEDLYIKLNSRGRTLSDFEKLKAWLEEHVEFERWKNVTLPKDWKRKLDNNWLDLFWKCSGSNTKTMDQGILAFFLGNALNLSLSGKQDIDTKLIQTVHEKGFLSKEEWSKIFTTESLPGLLKSMDELTKPGVREDLDGWGGSGKILLFSSQDKVTTAFIAGWKEKAFTYTDRFLFFGLMHFLNENEPDSPDWNESAFLLWMRLVRNLGENSNIAGNTLHNAIQSIRLIANDGVRAVDKWMSGQSTESVPTGLDKDQWRDEIEKAKLRLTQNCEDTSAALDAAEDQPFLRGQIGFLIAFATTEGSFDHQRFQSYAAAMDRHFSAENGPKKEDRVLLQQALLSIGDYSVGGSRKRLASNRDDWRDVFRNERSKYENHQHDPQVPQSVIKTFLDLGAEVDMDALIQAKLSALDWSNWRKWMLASKHPLKFCGSSRFDLWTSGNTVILLEGTDYRAASAELRTYFLFKEILEKEGWRYAWWLRENSHVYQDKDRIRLELRNLGATGFVFRLLCKDENAGLLENFQSTSVESPLHLTNEETANGWQRCDLLYLECRPSDLCYPEEVASIARDKWQALIESLIR